jgi:hypothetical protein
MQILYDLYMYFSGSWNNYIDDCDYKGGNYIES